MFGVLPGKEGRVVALDRKTRSPILKRRRHAVVEPGGGRVEAVAGGVAVAGKGHFVVAEKRGHEARTGLVGGFGDFADKRQRLGRGGHHEFLSGLEVQTHLHRDIREPAQFYRVDGGGRGCHVFEPFETCPHPSASPRQCNKGRGTVGRVLVFAET